MTWKKKIAPGEQVPLKLTPTETKAILEDLMCLDEQHEQAIQETPAGKPVMMTLDDLEDFAGYVAAEANHTEDSKLGRKLDKVFDKCQKLLDTYTDEPDEAITAEQAAQKLTKGISDVFSGKEPATIKFRLRSKTPKSAKFPIKMTQHQRDSLKHCTRLKAAVKRNIEAADEGTQIIEFTKKELDHMHDEIGQAVYYARSPHKNRLVALQKKVDDILNEIQLEDFGLKKPQRPSSASNLLFQFKITLLNTKPPIWRRIQVKDCTLDKLHEHIQTAMGWTNSHLHQFEIRGERYGDPQLLDYGYDDFDCLDSTRTMLTELIPKSGKTFRFKYEYDFGDCWEHEILFEDYPPIEKKTKYPLCVEGERACPPEDVGGVWGYVDFLAAIADPKHEQHEDFMEWCGGSFSAEGFDAKKATRDMKEGLPDWRE